MEKLIVVFQIVVLAAIASVGCTETEFSQKPPRTVKQEVNSGKVDILFVVDNSGSMYVEQTKMAAAFPTLVHGLDIAGLDYRIGITTTDVTSSLNPQKSLGGLEKGALQDGRLIKFGNGKLYLDNTDYDNGNIQGLFASRIQRQETLDCEAAGFVESKCPSGDERGIYAALKTVDRNEGKFFRTGSHIAFIFLTDEDVRGKGLAAFNIPGYPSSLLPTRGDYPATLIEYVLGRLGDTHTMSAHAIVTDTAQCRSQQVGQNNNSYIDANIGYFYMEMTNPSSPARVSQETLSQIAKGKLMVGTVGSICSANYTTQAGNIKNVVNQASFRHVAVQDLECVPESGTFQMDYIPAGISWSFSASQNQIVFSPALQAHQKAKFSYLCQ
ncbi:MAG: VWA domain-containing protein [Bdellovibrionaceae bacterium]|nr:VWA domain-containing protein [Pseudobdellovibrionaceae bacterium]